MRRLSLSKNALIDADVLKSYLTGDALFRYCVEVLAVRIFLSALTTYFRFGGRLAWVLREWLTWLRR